MREMNASATLATMLILVAGAPASAQQPHTLFGAPCTASADTPVTEPRTGDWNDGAVLQAAQAVRALIGLEDDDR